MFTVITLVVVAAMGYLLWVDRVNVIKEMKADISKAVSAIESSASKEFAAILESLKKHL